VSRPWAFFAKDLFSQQAILPYKALFASDVGTLLDIYSSTSVLRGLDLVQPKITSVLQETHRLAKRPQNTA